MNLYELVRYVQRSKNYNDQFTASSSPKLTADAQMALQIGSSGVVSLDNLDAAVNMVDAASIVPGTLYSIPGVSGWLYGGTEIILTGVGITQFSKEGWGLFYNPAYNLYFVWDDQAESYNIGDKVIYGGFVWTNISGSVGTSTDILNLDGNWNKISYNNVDYNSTWDYIEYDINYDYIITRADHKNNNIVSCDFLTNIWWFCGVTPIQVFRWGHPYNGNVGVSDCIVINSYINNLNFINGGMSGVRVTNFSSISGLQIRNYAYINNLVIDNYSSIWDLNLVQGSINNLYILNDSGLNSIDIENGNISDVTISGDSWVSDLTLTNGGRLSDCLFTTTGYMSNVAINNGSIQNCNFNSSNISDSVFNNSSLEYADCYKSYMWDIQLNGDSYICDITLNNSQLSGINGQSGYELYNIDLTGFGRVDSEYLLRGGQETASEYKYNTIKYQFNLNLGLVQGDITMPPYIVPTGFYPYKMILDAVNLSSSDGSLTSTLTLGIATDSPNGILNGVTILSLIGNIKEYFLTDMIPLPATQIRPLYGNIGVADATAVSGYISVELIFKNTNYSYDNND